MKSPSLQARLAPCIGSNAGDHYQPSGHIAEPFGPSPRAEFTLATTPTLIETDELATYSIPEACLAGFTCLDDDTGPLSSRPPERHLHQGDHQ